MSIQLKNNRDGNMQGQTKTVSNCQTAKNVMDPLPLKTERSQHSKCFKNLHYTLIC